VVRRCIENRITRGVLDGGLAAFRFVRTGKAGCLGLTYAAAESQKDTESLALSTKFRLNAALGSKTLVFAALAAVSGLVLADQPLPPLAPLALEGDLDSGKELAATCAGCHAIPGYRNAYPSFHVPKLGGQNADYLEIALQGYRRGSRPHDTMHAQAAVFSDQDIADVSAYIASLERSEQQGISRASAAMIRAGEEKSAVCAPCHGPTGVAPASQWPNIAGQHASYLERSLTQYKTGERNDLVMSPMATPLDEASIRELAAFFAAQPGLYTPDEM
jgi:cytochrome c553